MTRLDPPSSPAEQTLSVGQLLGKLGPMIGLIFVLGLFAALRWDSFVTMRNVELMLRQTAVVGTAALGMTLVIIAGGIDLSVGSAIALVTVAIALLLPHDVTGPTPGEMVPSAGVAPLIAALGGIAVGALCGLGIGAMVIGHVGRVFSVVIAGFVAVRLHIGLAADGVLMSWGLPLLAGLLITGFGLAFNEWLVKRVELAPFIVTLGLWGGLRGFAQLIANESMVYPSGHGTWLTRLLIPINRQHLWMLTPGAWMMLALAVLVAAMLRYTRFGRHIFAIGSNEQTARLCGVNVERTKLLIYTLAAAFTGLAGVLQFSYLTMGDPTTANGMELDIIAAVVIGGASLSGGQGSVLGSLVGALIMTVVSTGCNQLGLSNSVQLIVTGGIIILAVTLDQLRQRGNV